MRSRKILVGAAAAVAVLIVAAVAVRASQAHSAPVVIGVRQYPLNHSFSPIVARVHPNPYQLPYSNVAPLVPSVLPSQPAGTHCRNHIVVTEFLLSDGSTRRYGPCLPVPTAVRRVRDALTVAYNRSPIPGRLARRTYLRTVRVAKLLHPRTEPARLVGGSAAQRRLIERLVAHVPLPAAALIRIQPRYRRTPNSTVAPVPALIITTVPVGKLAVRKGWGEAANQWAADVLVREYNTDRSSDMPRIVDSLGTLGGSGYEANPDVPGPLPQTKNRTTLAGLRGQALESARQFHIKLVRVALIQAGGAPHAYVEFRAPDPARSARNWGWRPTGVASSVVLLDNPCGTPIAAFGASPSWGSVWTDPVWFTAGYATVGGMLGAGPGPPLQPKNRCY